MWPGWGGVKRGARTAGVGGDGGPARELASFGGTWRPVKSRGGGLGAGVTLFMPPEACAAA